LLRFSDDLDYLAQKPRLNTLQSHRSTSFTDSESESEVWCRSCNCCAFCWRENWCHIKKYLLYQSLSRSSI